MIQQKLPQEISYPLIIPKGFPTIFKQWELDPMSSNKQWSHNDIVRFLFMNTGKGVFDPIRSYIEITVSTDVNYHPVGLLQVDSSAQSFISQTVLYSDNREIQRITEYDTLAAYLNDIGYDQYVCQGRQSQGLGYGSFDTMPYVRTSGNALSSIRANQTPEQAPSITQSCANIFPTIGNYYPQFNSVASFNSIVNCAAMCKGHCTNSNVVSSGTDINGGSLQPAWSAIWASMKQKGYANNIRSQYQAKFTQNKYPESTTSIPNYELQLQQSVSGNGQYPFYYSKENPYYVQVRSTLSPGPFYDTQGDFNPQTITTANFGFNSLFCPNYTRGTFEPMISATVPQLMMYNGNFLQTKIPIMRRKFKLPLLSGVIGALIQQFILIPLASIQKCLLQITLSPFAMFTSGYSDVCELDDIGIKVQQKRDWSLERIQYKLQTYHFIDNQVEQYIQNSLVRQISVISNFWSLSNQYQIPGGTPPNNSYIIGCNSTHLNQCVALFVPNDYQTWSFCRKHYRISNNVTKFWSKLGVDYWPPQPWKGNGGNVVSNNYDDDNSQFVENIYWAGSYMFTKTVLPRINAHNFAINNRPYNPSNSQTFYDPSMLNNQNYSFGNTSVNADTALGMPWIHQNRVVGKAAYVISYTPFRLTNTNVLNGINVSSLSNFELIFDVNTDNTFPRDQTLYIFCRSSGVTKYSTQGIKTYGRG